MNWWKTAKSDDICHQCHKPSGKFQYFCRKCIQDIEHQQLDELQICPHCGIDYGSDCTHCERCGYEPGDPRPEYVGVK